MKKDIKHIVLVDAAHIFRTFWHASEHKPLGSAFKDTVDKIHGIAANQKYDAIICCIDAPPYLRAQSFPNYKANRPETAPEMHEQYKDVQDKLNEFGYHIWKSQGHEADDIIASATKLAVQMNIAVDIYTGDKDLLQLVSDEDRVQVISTRTGDAIDEAAVLAKLKVRPSRVGDYLALMGDKSDGIPGCPGVAEVRAAALTNTYEEWAVLMSDCKEGRVIGLKPESKLAHNLKENVGVMQNARALVTLVDDIPLTQWSELYEEKTMDEGVEFNVTGNNPAAEAEAKAIIEETERFLDGPGHPDGKGDSAENEMAASQIAKDVEMGERLPEEGHPDGKGDIMPGHDIIPAGDSVSKAVNSLARPPRNTPALAPQTLASIELRPGVSVTGAQYELFKTMAKDFHSSGLYKRKYENAQSIFTVMLLGLELGVSPQVACQNFHIIEGKPTPAAHFLIGLAKRDRDCLYFEPAEITATSVTYVCKKKSRPNEMSFTYTLEDAANDQMRWAKQKKNQKAMLRKTAGSQAARLWFPEACSGLYSAPEMGFDDEAGE